VLYGTLIIDRVIGVATAEQALVFLGADPSTPDDFIISMYAAKVRVFRPDIRISSPPTTVPCTTATYFVARFLTLFYRLAIVPRIKILLSVLWL
jgi:hypothetical protein